MKEDIKIIKEIFGRHCKRFGDSPQALGWENEYTQKMRFMVLSEIAPLEGMRILDVGCGKGDLFGFFKECGIPVEYIGVDLTLELVKLARSLYPDAQILSRDFLQDEYYPEIDYALASGVANVLTLNNQEYMEAIIKKMFSLARMGAAVNMISTYLPDDKKDTGIYCYSPETMFKFALKLTPRVILRHDYLPNDFTLYLYKVWTLINNRRERRES